MAFPQRMNMPRRTNAQEASTEFPHTVTLYNTRQETVVDGLDWKETTVNYITVLNGVLLDASKASNVRASGLDGADAVNLYVPFDVEAVDGITGEPKEYIGPVDFWLLSDEEKANYWTLTTGQDSWFVKGEALPAPSWPDDQIRELIEGVYDDVYNVTKVDVKDFGNLQHFEIGGA